MAKEITDALTSVVTTAATMSDQDALFCFPELSYDIVNDRVNILVGVSEIPPSLTTTELDRLKDQIRRVIVQRSLNAIPPRKRTQVSSNY